MQSNVENILGRHEALIEQILFDLQEHRVDAKGMRKDLHSIAETLAERRGERRVGTWLIASGAGAFGAIFAFVLRMLGAKLHINT